MIKIQPNYVKEGLLTFDNKSLFVEAEIGEDRLSAHDDVYLDTINLLRENETPSNLDLELFGGAKNDKKAVAKKEPKGMVGNGRNKSVLDIHKIGSAILKELLGDKINLTINTSDDARLMKFVMSFLNKHSYSLDNSEYEYLIRFLRDNLYKVVKESIMNRHSLAAISEYRLTSDMLTAPMYDPVACGNLLFNQKVAITREISNKWNGLATLVDLMGKTKMEKDVIDPLFFVLFANKLPGFEDLVIRNDYQSLVQQIRDKEVHKTNMFLFLLRMIDPSMLPTTDKDHATALGNETLRISISMLLRELSYNIRRGVFEDKASCLLVKLLDSIKMPTAKFREENMLQAILATFSFKPTLITRGLIGANHLGLLTGSPTSSILYEPPKSVYNIEYPISDMYCFSDNNIPRLSQNNFELLGFDSITKKIVFTYSDNRNIIQDEQTNLIQNLFNAISSTKNRIETDVNNVLPTIVARQPALENLYKNMTPVQVLLTNGFYVSVPREQNRLNSCPTTNIFFRPAFKPTINLSPILIEPTVTVNRITYELVGALCYDIIDDDSILFGSPIFGGNINVVEASLKLGTFGLVKSNGAWYEYNPQDSITLERKKNKLDRVLINRYRASIVNNAPAAITFETWKTDNIDAVKKDMDENKFTISDFQITESEALEKMSTRCCLLFYAEDYDVYQSRVFEKCF